VGAVAELYRLHTPMKKRKICEVFGSTIIIAAMTVTVFSLWTVIRNTEYRSHATAGRLMLGFVGSIFFGLLTMGVFIFPSALLISVVITFLKRWSLRSVAILGCAAVICSSVSNYLIDPTQSQEQHGAVEYFTRFEWFASKANLVCFVTGFIASLIAFWIVQRFRRRYETAA
jgi:hypothetical protein